jgi:MFS family permease
MVLLDGTITIVALPSIGGGLRFSEQGLQWVLSACALTFGGLLLLGGRAADLLGRRRVFMAGAVFFTTASLLCGLARSPAALLAAGLPSLRRAGRDRPGAGVPAPGRPRKPPHELPEPDPAADAAAAGDAVIRSGTK